jgi:hypothetical protein
MWARRLFVLMTAGRHVARRLFAPLEQHAPVRPSFVLWRPLL